MQLHSLSLTNFRTYTQQSFTFTPLTIIVGRNTIGKTNILEAVNLLSTGKSFRADKDVDTIQFGKNFARIDALLEDDTHPVKISAQLINNSVVFHKRFSVNEVGKRLNDFVSFFPSIIFSPQDLEIISDSPNLRRQYVDGVLSATSPSYRLALSLYSKALKQRNKLLSLIKNGKREYSPDEFLYWNSLLLEHAVTITQAREKYVEYMNTAAHTAFSMHVTYDKSAFTLERLTKYKDAEFASGVTLIGPQRDDFLLEFDESRRLIREFASRGEQRLTVLQLKLLEIAYVEEKKGEKAVLLLDDIFSELDSRNIDHISRLLPHQQSIITTTHLEHIPEEILEKAKVIRLPKDLEKNKNDNK